VAAVVLAGAVGVVAASPGAVAAVGGLPLVTSRETGRELQAIEAEFGDVRLPAPTRLSWPEGNSGRTFELHTSTRVLFAALFAYRAIDANGLPAGTADRVVSCGAGLEPQGCELGVEHGHTVVEFTDSVPAADRYQTLRVEWEGPTTDAPTDWVSYQLPLSGAAGR
jgi:hypothetical protein